MKKYIKFTFENKGISGVGKNLYTYSYNIERIDAGLYRFLTSKGKIWHVDFENKKIFPKHDGSFCFLNDKRYSIYFTSYDNYIQELSVIKKLHRISLSKNKTNLTTSVKDLDKLFINAMYILVETYKKSILKL